ncbi:MAG: 4a-hydroxytetrahydrobiopterin dehydratase [Actinomycetota bacterium]
MSTGFPSGWLLRDGALHRDFVFVDFEQAFAFMAAVAAIAESMNHHPDWSNSWNKVSISLVSHDVGRVTERDIALAEGINTLL